MRARGFFVAVGLANQLRAGDPRLLRDRGKVSKIADFRFGAAAGIESLVRTTSVAKPINAMGKI
jgi:hypothetical protein